MLALALAAAAQDVPADPPEETDIVIIGQRLARLSVFVGRDALGSYTCALSEPTGSERLDRQLCRTAARCVRQGAANNDAVRACIDQQRPALLEDIRRRLTRSAGR